MLQSHLASRFGRGAPVLRSNSPLSDEQIMAVAPSIFGAGAHESRSARYSYIPTIDVLQGLRREGFRPFMVAQTRVRLDDRRDFTKHMIRLRHAGDIGAPQANEIILLNSHDGTSSYQLLSGIIRFVCLNSMVCGTGVEEVKVRHSGNVVHNVIEGAFSVVDQFAAVDASREGMQALALPAPAQEAFATAALALRYDEEHPAPIAAHQLLSVRRHEDRDNSLWTTFNRVQENMVAGGNRGRNAAGRRMTTRAVTGIDQSVKLNRALWVLAEEMRKLAA